MKRTHEDKGKAHQDSGGGSDDDNGMEKTLNRGPWTQLEDDLLIAYITLHGDGNWNAVAKNSNLSRCGKSCRLRWMNHLRPNLKKGAFSKEEEERVVELHAAMGNRWAKMTSHLPGRTDNEIKNFWNTRIKRMKRQGLPVYPDGVRERAMNAAAQSGLNTGHSLNPQTSQDSLEQVMEELPVPDFKFLHADPTYSCYQPMDESFLRQRLCFSQPNMYNSVASSLGTGGGSLNEQNLPPGNYSFPERTLEDVPDIHMLDNGTYYFSSGTSRPFTSGGSNNEQSLPFENCPFAESTLEYVPDIPMLDNGTFYSSSGTALAFTSGGSMNVESQYNMYNSIAPSSGTALPFTSGGSMNGESQHNMYNSIAPSSGTALPFTSGGSMNVESQHSMYNSIAPSSGTALPFTSGGSMNVESQHNMYNSIAPSSGTALPFTSGGYMNGESQHNMYNSIAPSSGTALPFTSGGSMNEQSLPLENYPLVESTREHVLPSEPPSFQYFASHEEPGTRRAQQSDPIPPELESDKTLVQPPLIDQTPSNFPSGERQATETDLNSLLDLSSVLDDVDLPLSPGTNFDVDGDFPSISLEDIDIYFDEEDFALFFSP